MLGFYKYALTRSYVDKIPLPTILPHKAQQFVPYIYSKNELKLLFKTALEYQKKWRWVSPQTLYTFFVLTYALGLRLNETLSITLNDIDLKNLVLTIKTSKFFKSRFVPFNHEVKTVIQKYLTWRMKNNKSQDKDSYFLVTNGNQPLNRQTIHGIFVKIRERACLKRDTSSTYQPRIHDLRHTFAVNRLTSWYQQNKNVQQLLPILSTYLGHRHISNTSAYLTITDDILRAAKNRFEKYAVGDCNER